MNDRLKFFVLGALAASVFWWLMFTALNHQLLDTFLGFTGRS
jgi:hypothetical protein